VNQRLTLFRKDTGSQAMRQSAALTTVYLLELNRKFEAFMREQVDRLESRVSAQQARLSAKAPVEAEWEDAFPVEAERTAATIEFDEVAPLEPAAGFGEADDMKTADNDHNTLSEQSSQPVQTEMPDYTALLIGDTADITSADPVFEMAAAEPAEAGAARPEADEPADIVENDDVGADPERVEDNTGQLIEETALASGVEPIDAAEKPATPGAPPDDDIVTGAAKLVRLTGDPRPDAAGIPASELLRDEPEQMISWSPEADLSEETTKAAPANRAEATASEGEALEMADEPADWDTVLPAAGQKRNWA
jgi:hypothetical protein